MGQASALPTWVNLIWMSINFITLIGAIIWTIFIFWPYLRATKKLQIDGLAVGVDSNENLKEMINKIDPLVAQADRVLENVDQVTKRLNDKRLEKILAMLDDGRLDKILEEGAKRTEPLPVKRRGDEDDDKK